MRKNKPMLHDPLIISRVKQYLEENVDKKFLDVGVMTKQLQERYPEYSRRKIAPFRALVEQAYRIVSHSYGMESQPSSGDDSDGSDLEVMDDSVANNLMNNMMNNLYQKPKSNSSKVTPAKQPAAEAIDISSDDDSVEDGRANGKEREKTAGSEKQSGAEAFRGVILTKMGANAETSSKGSSSTSMNTDSTSASLLTGAHKRHEFPDSGDQQQQQQPNKKRKLDALPNVPVTQSRSYMNTHFIPIEKSDRNAAQHEQRHGEPRHHGDPHHPQSQHQHNSNTRMPRFGNNSMDIITSRFPPNGNQLRQRKFKKEVQLRKSRETFQDIGGMEKTLKELCELLMHIKSPDIYFVLGLMPPRGLLLHGPPGCGKTLLAHAIAGQLNLPLIEVPATELVAGVSGESEERIRDVFEQATIYAPCVLFIDEIDAVSSNRSLAQKDMERRIVSQLISSLDNLKLSEDGQSVLVIGATTRPDVLDPALRRVGRFDHEIAIGIPTRKDRKDILTIICYGLSVDAKCDFDKIAELTPGYVGADLLALVSRAATIAVKRECCGQIHNFQLESQRNITIVDLDDDADENTESTSKQAAADKTTEESTSEETPEVAKEKATPNTEEEMDVEKGAEKSTTEDGKTGEKSTTEDGKTVDVVSVINGANGDDGTTDKVESTDLMEVDENDKECDEENTSKNVTTDSADSMENKSTDTVSKEDKSSKSTKESDKDTKDPAALQNMPEPSLLELLNWLDNPPEDITYSSRFCITFEDFCEAVKVVQPSSKREGFITVPDVTWADVGSLQDIREELQLAVLAPVKFPEKMIALGLTAPSGVLLCGPPGCGKTLLAKAIANEAGVNFISVKGPELMNMYVGESERAVRACFQRARNSAPCVIFFDEFDSLCPKRSETNEASSGTRVVNQLLTEMDGVEDRKGVYVLAASNRPDIIDPAILRPGRLDTVLYVGLPQSADRVEILKATTKNGKRPVLADDIDFDELASKTDGYTGADLAGLVRQAAMLALKESLSSTDTANLCVNKKHMDNALKLIRPSVSAQDRKIYEKLRLKYAAPRLAAATNENAE